MAQPSLTHRYCQPIDGWQPTGAAGSEWEPGKKKPAVLFFYFLLMLELNYVSLS